MSKSSWATPKPYHREDALTEAVKFIQTVCRGYREGRRSAEELDTAAQNWIDLRKKEVK